MSADHCVFRINPVFDIYRVTDTFPSPCKIGPSSHLPFTKGLLLRERSRVPAIDSTVHLLQQARDAPNISVQTLMLSLGRCRTDVQDAIHAPHIEWSDCAAIAPYVNETDNSVPPAANHVLPNVIEKSERSAVVHGLAVRITFFS